MRFAESTVSYSLSAQETHFPGFRNPEETPLPERTQSAEKVLKEFRANGVDVPYDPKPPTPEPAPVDDSWPSRRHIRRPRCKFCEQSGEEDIWHDFKEEAGKVVCPVLFGYTCKLCGATGGDAHTLKYCPMNKLTHGDPVAAGMAPGLIPNNITLEDLI